MNMQEPICEPDHKIYENQKKSVKHQCDIYKFK